MFVEISLPQYVFCTTTQIKKLHHQFSHRPTEKLIELLRKTGREGVKNDTIKALEEITRRCETFQ